MDTKHIEIKPMTWVLPEFSVASKCDLDIYAGDKGVLVIATERPDNKETGLSITEGPGLIAQTLYRWYGYEPERMTWIESNPEKNTYAQVELLCSDHRVDDWKRKPCSPEVFVSLKIRYQG